ncbi:MAG TPA: phosphatidylserine decarboxylase family protein [Gemmatimonadales bacterium]|nr:phosphatidylserine decarboxylase family protein [Gemmatimonadales bacterium]
MRVAKEGWPFIAIFWAVLALFWFLHWTIAFWVWLPVAIWCIAFFRDPVREGERGPNVVIAPADGKVVSIVDVDEPTFVGGRATRIAIFMNVFDVHVNRYPMDGTVSYRHYNAGRFGHAAEDKASELNEQSSVGLTTAKGKVLVRQIAGLVARRIITDHSPSTVVKQGERMGLIRFGSRVDVFLPPGTTVAVRVGERTQAGKSVIARWS